MSKKAREKPAEAGSASVSPYGSVLGYELVTSQPNRLINLIWPECRTWFIGPWPAGVCAVCLHLRALECEKLDENKKTYYSRNKHLCDAYLFI